MVKNSEFENNVFMNEDGPYRNSGKEITAKFEQITDIVERRINPDNILTSIYYHTAQEAIDDAGIDKTDYIIVAHNLGDVKREHFF